jgi:hypothetical protein
MSQNDFTIANQTFPNTRADINSALQALASTSSGTSVPSTTFANQLWYDTANNKLYIRNEDNDANIQLLELDQTNDTVEYYLADSIRTALLEFTDGDDALSIADGGAITISQSLNMNGTELILDADGDSSLTADTDDEVDLKLANIDVAKLSTQNSGDLVIKTVVGDKDFVIKGVDGSSEITALTIDMSEAGAATFNNDVTAFSDKRLKENIETIENPLDKVIKLRGVFFDRNGKRGTGVIAQEVQEVMPEVVHTNQEYLSVAYGNLVGLLIESIKELNAEVKSLKEGK